MQKTRLLTALIVLCIIASSGLAYYQAASVGENMTAAAQKYLASLDNEKKAASIVDFKDTEARVRWHFIPREMIKYPLTGLQIKNMNSTQKSAALGLLQSCLSKVGYDKATKIMELEHILHVLGESLEAGKRKIR